MVKPEVIRDSAGKPTFALIAWVGYERIAISGAEIDLSDEDVLDLAIARDAESVPTAVTDRLFAGERPVRVHRDRPDPNWSWGICTNEGKWLGCWTPSFAPRTTGFIRAKSPPSPGAKPI